MTRLLLFLLLLLIAQVLWAAGTTSERWSNGMRMIVHPMTASGVVSAELLIDYSATDEPEEMLGLRQVLISSMLQGSSNAGGTVIRRKLTAVGGQLTGRVQQELLEFSVTVPADALSTGLAALAEIVCHPSLTDESINLAVQRSRQLLQRDPDGAEGAAELISHYLLYGAHPFAVNGLGTDDTVAQITPEAVRAAYHDYVTPQSAVLAVAGHCSTAGAQGQARAVFGLWNGPARQTRLFQPIPSLSASHLELRELPVRSSCVMLTFPVCGAREADYLPLRLIDTLLAGGTSARLFHTVREEKHLAYEVSTIFPPQVTGTGFSLYALTRTGALEKTKTALVGELERLQTLPVLADELQRAKALMKSRYLFSHQYSSQYAFDLAWYEIIGAGADYDRRLPQLIDTITADDLQRVARTYFTHYYLVVVIPQIDPAGFSLIQEEEGPDS